MNILPNILIVSVFQKSRTNAVNTVAHKDVFHSLKSEGIPVTEMQSRYNGFDELSLLIEGFEHQRLVERLAKEFNQECYLESHNDRATFLVFPNGSRQAIGTLTSVTEKEAKTYHSYVYNPVSGQYFVTKL